MGSSVPITYLMAPLIIFQVLTALITIQSGRFSPPVEMRGTVLACLLACIALQSTLTRSLQWRVFQSPRWRNRFREISQSYF